MADAPKPGPLPVWALAAPALLFGVLGFAFGVEVGRHLANAHPGLAADIHRYTRPVIVGSLAALVALSVWFSTWQNRA